MTSTALAWVSGIVLGLTVAGCGGASEAGSGGGDADSPSSSRGLVGHKAPDFSVDAVANAKGTLSLADLRGKVVLVDFWGTFCEPC
jgi:thiol-disulfide isomerase/thioredoxin